MLNVKWQYVALFNILEASKVDIILRNIDNSGRGNEAKPFNQKHCGIEYSY